MSSLNFIGGEKSGVGKSVLARLLAQYFIDKAQVFVGFDTDRSHTSFTRFYADYASPVLVDSYEGLDRVVGVFEGSMRKIDRSNASFWAALNNRSETDALDMLERQRVKTWLRKSYDSFDTLPL